MTPRRAFLLAFAGFFLLAGAWAIALPVNGTYDESQHLIRAYAAADGQWLPHGAHRLSFRVPASLLPENPDCTWKPRPQSRPASCQRPATTTGSASTETYVARYSPVYYLPVGVPLRLWPDRTGVLLARLISALLNALMLAAAVRVAVRIGNRLLVAAIALVATPMVVNLAGSVNPNGLEISAAVLLFTALLGLLRGAPRRGALTLAGVALFALVTLRHLGPLLAAVDLAAVGVLAGAARVRAELRRRDTLTRLGGGAVAGLAVAGAWALAARSPVGEGPGDGLDLGPGGVVRGLFQHRIEFYVKQIVGQFGYGETTISPLAILLWYALVGALVLPALWRGGRRVLLVGLGLAVAGFAMLIGFEFWFVRAHGWFSHGRYALPILVGVVLVAAWSRPPVAGEGGRRRLAWPAALVAATAPVHLYALARVMTRFQSGIDAGLDPFGGSWRPPLGSALPLVAVLAGVALLTVAAWRPTRVADGDEYTTSEGPSTRTVPAN